MTQKTALICGASGGLGRVLAETLQERGLVVFGTMRSPPTDQDAFAFPMLALDAGDDSSVANCLEEVRQRTGRIDVIVNCINEMILGTVDEMSMEEFDRVFAVNVSGTARINRAAFGIMREQGEGLIINMSSLGGILAVPLLSAYTASKFAIEAFSEALHHEAKPYGVDVVIMQPVAMRMDRADTGSHLKIASGVTEGSPTHQMVRLMAKDTNASKLTPELVADHIYRVIESDNRKLRYPLDRAKLVGKLKRFAPRSVTDKIVTGVIRNHHAKIKEA